MLYALSNNGVLKIVQGGKGMAHISEAGVKKIREDVYKRQGYIFTSIKNSAVKLDSVRWFLQTALTGRARL